jgi:light-regulated signal transduction histidine kinase (bacteriophytochrome)
VLSFADLAAFSPLPLVNLGAIGLPLDGFAVPTNETCRRNFRKGAGCPSHYASLAATAAPSVPIACPFGFSSMVLCSKAGKLALTGFVPYPRAGTLGERAVAKAHPDTKVTVERLLKVAEALSTIESGIEAIEQATVKNHAMALHEIRKLNRNVKQGAERLCRDESPGDPDQANPAWVQIWKAAELMSRQFDIIEILANESLTQLPVESQVRPYPLFDKCARIYRPIAEKKSCRILLRSAPAGFSPMLQVCDSTFSIIPSVLIENAIKYALPNTDIHLDFTELPDGFRVTVTNIAKLTAPLTPDIFLRGVRSTSEVDGSGNGLYVAQLIAAQHRTEIAFEVEAVSGGRFRCGFSLTFRGK